MDPDKDNANPTIINPSDLPTRRRQSDEAASIKRRTDGGTGLFDSYMPGKLSYGYDPFAAPLPSEPSSPSSSGAEDDIAEDIDEQEIYGMWTSQVLHLLLNVPSQSSLICLVFISLPVSLLSVMVSFVLKENSSQF